jgi:hypothetical protein
MTFSKIAGQEVIGKASEALAANGFNVVVVETGEQAKQEVLNLIPKNAEVMTMTSVTLESIGIAKAINDSGDYDSVRLKLNTMNRETQGRDMQKLGAAPTYTIGSVHAITQDGKVLIASNTGSQLPAYAYGAGKVIWVVGAQKIVKNLDDAMRRIYEYVLPLESERAKKAYGAPGSFVSKLLIVNKEVTKDRITIVIVKEPLGF